MRMRKRKKRKGKAKRRKAKRENRINAQCIVGSDVSTLLCIVQLPTQITERGRYMIRLLLAAVALSSVLFGQRTEIVYQKIVEGLTFFPYHSAPLRNVGGNGHILSIRLYSNSPNTCTSPQTVDLGMESSFNKTLWTSLGSQVSLIAETSGVIGVNISGIGAFPFVRAAIRSFDNVNCQMDVGYSSTTNTPPGLTISAFGPKFMQVINKSTGNATLFNVGQVLTIAVKGPANANIRLIGTKNGNPYDQSLGTSDSNGEFEYETTLGASDTGSYNTSVVGLAGDVHTQYGPAPFEVQ
jgi:hypothetical protein